MDSVRIRKDLGRRLRVVVAAITPRRLRHILWAPIALFALLVLILAGFRVAAALRETQSAVELAPREGQFVASAAACSSCSRRDRAPEFR
jgi:hypothetical protein